MYLHIFSQYNKDDVQIKLFFKSYLCNYDFIYFNTFCLIQHFSHGINYLMRVLLEIFKLS
jgi:hypothetical protein